MSVCTEETYTCGDMLPNQKTMEANSAQLTQTINSKYSFFLDATEVIVKQRVRNFNISTTDTWRLVNSFVVNTGSQYVNCGAQSLTNPHHVSEDYFYKTTTLNFLDTRYANAVGVETTEHLTFSYSGSDMAGFLGSWGLTQYHKFLITNAIINKTINYFVVLKGIKHILKTNVSLSQPYTSDFPLILVWGNPPSDGIPWTNAEDIKIYGFYDYHQNGPGDYGRIAQDGGDDYYFTDWMRLIGTVGSAQDQIDADNRFQNWWLASSTVNDNIVINNPDLFVDTTPSSSISQDISGNIFYSILFDGEYYNKLLNTNLSEVDLAALFPDFKTNPRFYPVSIL